MKQFVLLRDTEAIHHTRNVRRRMEFLDVTGIALSAAAAAIAEHRAVTILAVAAVGDANFVSKALASS